MPRHKPQLSEAGTVRFKEEEIIIPFAQLDSPQQANEAGACGRCGKVYKRNDWVFRDEGEVVGVNCCATAEDLQTTDDETDVEGREFVPLSQVMPTGKSRADMCPDCFQIPASNGICGC